MRLTDKAKAAASTNTRLKNLLALEFNRSVFTIQKWIAEGNIILTTPSATAIIKEETGLTDQEILEEGEPVHAGK
jgi:hypothetical protein